MDCRFNIKAQIFYNLTLLKMRNFIFTLNYKKIRGMGYVVNERMIINERIGIAYLFSNFLFIDLLHYWKCKYRYLHFFDGPDK